MSADAFAKDTFGSWIRSKVWDRLRPGGEVAERLDAAVDQGLTFIVVPVSPPPRAGTPARQHWEDACDRCDILVPDDMLMFRETCRLQPADGVSVDMIITGGLCRSCAAKFGGTVDENTRPQDPDAIRDVHAVVGPEAFQTLLGEAFEQAEFAERQHRTGRRR